MEQLKLGEMEQRFAELIWAHAPITTRELTEKAAQNFDWKRTTTYTMLKRLCERGIFENTGGTIVTILTREEFSAAQGEQFLKESFGGSLPRFFAAFTRQMRISDREIAEIQRLIDEYREG